MQHPNRFAFATSSRSVKERFIAAATGVVLLHLLLVYALMSGLASRVTQALPQLLEVRLFEAPPAQVQLPPPPLPDLAQPQIVLVPAPEIHIAAPMQTHAITAEQKTQETKATAPNPAPVTSKAPANAIAPTTAKSIAGTHTTPPYPPLARRLGEEGIVQLRLVIDANGTIAKTTLEKSSGSERLDEAAITWVQRHWRYHPATRDGKPVASQTQVNVVFNLKVTR